MTADKPSFKDDLQIPIGSVILLQTIIALAYIIPIESSPILSAREELRIFEPIFFFIPLITLWLQSLREWAGRWFAIIAAAALVLSLHYNLHIPGMLALLSLPVALAAGLVGLRAAAVVSLLGSGLLLSLHATTGSPDGAQLIIGLVAIGGVYLMSMAMRKPINSVADWSWGYYQQANQLVVETRAQREELNQALDDLEHANRQMALLYEKQTALQLIAEEARRTKTSFVAKVSHEFRTPLNMIIGLAAVMVENPQMYGRALSPALLEDLRIIQRNCEHLSSLVNDVLALSQAQAGQLALHREPLHLDELIHGALDVVRPLLKNKNLYLDLSIPDHLSEMSCDRTRIRQVVLNLLSNAARFTDQGGIAVRVEEQETNMLIQVGDTGPGISPEDIDRIFEPFCQGSTQGWRDKGGSGLGLTISKQFVELHGGKIWLESELGAGTTFFVSLPKSAPLAPTARPERWINREWAWVERKNRPNIPNMVGVPRVVLFDQTSELDQAFNDFSNNIELVTAGSLDDVINSIQDTPAHVVVIGSPEAQDLHHDLACARSSLPDTPVVGCIVPSRISPALEAGADQYLVKPIQQAVLFEAIRGLQRSPRSILIADDDPDAQLLLSRMVVLFDRSIEITLAASGQEALELIQSRPIDLLLLDMVMPQADGMQVLNAIRENPCLSDLMVIVISAQDPMDSLPVCQEMVFTLGEGISLPKALECSLELSDLMFKP